VPTVPLVMGGRNVVAAAKTLKKDALEDYSLSLLTRCRMAKCHAAFKGRLNDKQIEDVAPYVLEQSGKGWI